MAKKKTTGPALPANSVPAPTRLRTASTTRKAVRPDPGVAEPGVTPEAQPLDLAADMSVGAGSSDSPASREPSHDEIAEAAYHRYLQRGERHGNDWDDWLEAERTLKKG
jgi:hypothetical protein